MRLIMRDPKALSLFAEVLKKTEAGKIPWQPTAEDGHFIASMMGKYTLDLRPHATQYDWNTPPAVAFNDDKGNTLIEMTDAVDGITADELKTLAVFARRIALQADQRIDELLAELKKEDDIPF
jgi:hypothetical protein